MPIRISCVNGIFSHEVAWLCEDDWLLSVQVEALRNWLDQVSESLSHGEYVADIGYSTQEDMVVGSARIPVVMMKRMAEIGIELLLTEYPPFVEDADARD